MRIFIVYYSLYGHIHKMAQAVSEGVSDAGFKAELFRVPETLPDVVIEKMGATSFQTEFRKLPVITPDELSKADAVIFGTPTQVWKHGRTDASVFRFDRRDLEQRSSGR
jgi:Multimeric flavodoxin WrbA